MRTKKSYIEQGKKMRGRIVSESTRGKLSVKSRGRKFSDTVKQANSERVKTLWEQKWYRDKLVKAHIGQKAWNAGKKCPNMADDKHPMWKGENVGYHALHVWIRKKLGKPKKCEHCGTTTALYFDWSNKSREYKRDLSDWQRLCRSCHKKYDAKPK